MTRHDPGRSKVERVRQRSASTFTLRIVFASTILSVVAMFSPRGSSMQASNENLRSVDPPRIYVIGLGAGPGILFTQPPSVGLLRSLLDRIRPDVIFTDLTSGFVEQGSPDHYLPYEWSQVVMPYSREKSIPFVPVSSPRDASQSFIRVEFHLIDLCAK